MKSLLPSAESECWWEHIKICSALGFMKTQLLVKRLHILEKQTVLTNNQCEEKKVLQQKH